MQLTSVAASTIVANAALALDNADQASQALAEAADDRLAGIRPRIRPGNLIENNERATFGDLKGVLFAFARHLFGADTDLRFRANHFPFTEPSAEMDVRWRGEWLEWGGCGMIHPRVLARCEIDPDTWQGFAFGMGIDRTALLRWGFPTLRPLFEGDMRILEQI